MNSVRTRATVAFAPAAKWLAKKSRPVVRYLAAHVGSESNEFDVVRFLFTVVVLGAMGGLVSSLYLFILNSLVKLTWDIIFHALVNAGMFSTGFPVYCYIWVASFFHIAILAFLVYLFPAATTSEFGEAVSTIHSEGRIPPKNIIPMFIFSLLSVSSGAGVGPEAPILVIGGGIASFIGGILKLNKKSLRMFTLAGTYAALSAFFGSPVSGVHALEFPHKVGMEFFEAFPVGVAASFISSTILQLLFDQPYGVRFSATTSIEEVRPIHVFIALALAVFSAIVCTIFWGLVTVFRLLAKRSQLKQKAPYLQPFVAWVVFSVAGMLLPAILFWGEPDLQNIIDQNLTPLSRWKGGSSGIIDLGTTYSLATVIMIGVTKMLVLTVCVTHSIKGGVLFPLFAIGGIFGQAIHLITGLEQGLAVGCCMAAIQAGITRTPLASSLVTTFLFAEFKATMFIPIACCSFTTYFLTYPFPVFEAQQHRSDLKPNPEDIKMGTLPPDDSENLEASVLAEGKPEEALKQKKEEEEHVEAKEDNEKKGDKKEDKDKQDKGPGEGSSERENN